MVKFMENSEKNLFDLKNSETFFSNIITLTTNGEDVQIGFGVKEDKNDKGEIIVTHRVIMSINHFLRMSQMFDDIRNKMENDGLIIKHPPTRQ